MTAHRRDTMLQIRLTKVEKRSIVRYAQEAGYASVAPYVRDRALRVAPTNRRFRDKRLSRRRRALVESGAIPATSRPLIDPDPAPEPVAPPSIEEPKREVAPAPSPLPARSTAAEVDRERIRAEVAEARMSDDAAQEAFIERRTRELMGEGNTSLLARRLAGAEWRKRGS